MFGWIRKKITKIQEKRKAKKEVKKLKKLAKKQAGPILIEEQDNFATLNQDEPVDTVSQLDDKEDLDAANPTDMVVEVHAGIEENGHTDAELDDVADINDEGDSDHTDPDDDDEDAAVHNDAGEAVSADTEVPHQAVTETENPKDTAEGDHNDPEDDDEDAVVHNSAEEAVSADTEVPHQAVTETENPKDTAEGDHNDPEDYDEDAVAHNDVEETVSADTEVPHQAVTETENPKDTAEGSHNDPEDDDEDAVAHNDAEEAVSADTEVPHQAVTETENPKDTAESNHSDPELPNQTETEAVSKEDLERICTDPQVIALAGWIMDSLRHTWYTDGDTDVVVFYLDLEEAEDHHETGEPSATSVEDWVPVCMESDQKVRVNRCGSEPELTDVSNDDPIQYVRNHERFKRRRWDLAARPSFLSTLKKSTEKKRC